MSPSLALVLSLSLINPPLVTLAATAMLAPAAVAAEPTPNQTSNPSTNPSQGSTSTSTPSAASSQAGPAKPAGAAELIKPAQTAEAAELTKPAEPTEPTGADMAHTCAACHGTNGILGDEYFMPLAGMPVTQFVTTMRDFRSGERLSTLMGHVASGFSDGEIQAMGEFFAAVPLPATPAVGGWPAPDETPASGMAGPRTAALKVPGERP